MSRVFGAFRAEASRPARRDLFSRVWEAADPSGRRAGVLEFDARRLDPDLGARRWRAFEARVRLQQRIHEAAGWESCWAPVHGAARSERGWHAVFERVYPATARDLARRESPPVDAATLRAIALGALTALRQARRAAGRGHGNLKPSNVLLDRLPAPGAPARAAVLTDPDAESPPADEPRDLADLGAVLYEVIAKRPYPGAGGLVLNVWGPEARALGRAGPAWAAFCSDLLERRLRTVDEALERVPAIMPARRRRYAAAAAAVVVLALGVGAAALWAQDDDGVPSDYAGPRGNPRVLELIAFEERLRPLRRALSEPGAPAIEPAGGGAALAGAWRAVQEIDAEQERASEIKPEKARSLKASRDHYWANLIVRAWKKQSNFRGVLDGTGPTNDQWQAQAAAVLDRAQRQIEGPLLDLAARDAGLADRLEPDFPRTAARVRARVGPLLVEGQTALAAATKDQWRAWLADRPALDALGGLPEAAEVERAAAGAGFATPDRTPALLGLNEAIDARLAEADPAALPSPAAVAEAQGTADAVRAGLEAIAAPEAVHWGALRQDPAAGPLLAESAPLADLRRWPDLAAQYQFLPAEEDPRRAGDWSSALGALRDRLGAATASPTLPPRYRPRCAAAEQAVTRIAEGLSRAGDLPWVRRSREAVAAAAGEIDASLTALETEVAAIEKATRYEGYVEAKRGSGSPQAPGAPAAVAASWPRWLTALCDFWQPRQDAETEEFDAVFAHLERQYLALAGAFPVEGVPGPFLDGAMVRREAIAAALVADTGEPPPDAARDAAAGQWRRAVQTLADAEPRYDSLRQSLADLEPIGVADLAGVRSALAAAGVEEADLAAATASGLAAAGAALDASASSDPAALERVLGDAAAHPAVAVAAWVRLAELARGAAGVPGEAAGAAETMLLDRGQALRQRVLGAVASHPGGGGSGVAARLDSAAAAAWERIARDAADRASLERALGAAPGLGVSLDDVGDARVRANWRLHALANLAARAPIPDEESLKGEIDLALADLEALGPAGAPTHLRLRRIRNAKSGAADFTSCGPGSAPEAAFAQSWSATPAESDAAVTYTNPALPGVAITFIRVNPDENDPLWSYVATEEVSFALFKAVVEGSGTPGERLRFLLREQPPDDHAAAAWRLDPETGELILSEEWFPRIAPSLAGTAAVAPPADQSPMNAMGAGAAVLFCRVLGCRPPTPQEWRRALEIATSGAVGADGPSPASAVLAALAPNLRDARVWPEQVRFTQEQAAENISFSDPRDIAVARDPATKDLVWESPRVEDPHLFYAPVGVGGEGSGPFRHLVGNVMELALAPDAAADDALPSLSALLGDLQRWEDAPVRPSVFLPAAYDPMQRAGGRPEALLAIGGSALSAPVLNGEPWPLAAPVPLVTPASVGRANSRRTEAGNLYSDLGVRLAFSTVPTPPGPLWERVVAQAKVESKPWYVLP